MIWEYKREILINGDRTMGIKSKSKSKLIIIKKEYQDIGTLKMSRAKLRKDQIISM